MVAKTNTVVDPRAVMIVPINTPMTNDTVSASRRPNCVALRTQGWTIKKFQKFQEIYVIVDDVSRISCNEYDVYHECDCIKRGSDQCSVLRLTSVDLKTLCDNDSKVQEIKSSDCGFVLLHFLDRCSARDHVACWLVWLKQFSQFICELRALHILHVIKRKSLFIVPDVNVGSLNKQRANWPAWFHCIYILDS